MGWMTLAGGRNQQELEDGRRGASRGDRRGRKNERAKVRREGGGERGEETIRDERAERTRSGEALLVEVETRQKEKAEGGKAHLEVVSVLVGKRSVDGGLGVGIELGTLLLGEVNLRGSEGRGGDEVERRVANELASEPEERLLEVVVGLGRDLEVLEVLLAVEGDGSGLDLALLWLETGQDARVSQTRLLSTSARARRVVTHLDVNLVSAEDDGDVLADALEIAVPVGDVLVGDPGGDVEHDDTWRARAYGSMRKSLATPPPRAVNPPHCPWM